MLFLLIFLIKSSISVTDQSVLISQRDNLQIQLQAEDMKLAQIQQNLERAIAANDLRLKMQLINEQITIQRKKTNLIMQINWLSYLIQ